MKFLRIALEFIYWLVTIGVLYAVGYVFNSLVLDRAIFPLHDKLFGK